MSKGNSPPPAPDPNVVANAQTGTNISTGIANATLNHTGQNNPFYSTNYTQNGGYTDPKTGMFVPSYNQNFKLGDLGQALLTQANGSATKPLDFSGADNDYLRGGPQALDDKTSDAYYAHSKGFLDPEWEQKSRDLQDQLSRQGIPVGSDAYNNAMKQHDNARTQAYDAARSGATAAGASGASNMFGMALQGQQQNIAQQQTAQQNPLKLLGSVIGGGGTA